MPFQAAREGGGRVSQAGEVRLARVESLRALAALSVLAAHAYAAAHSYPNPTIGTSYPQRLVYGGVMGVFLFFALSGYLLFWPFVRRGFGDGAPIDLRRYAINRVLRIVPLYYAVAVVVLLLQEGGGSSEAWWRFMLWAENLTVDPSIAGINSPVWSVIVELHFYILLPFLAWAVVRLSGGSLARAAVVLGGLAAASLALRLATVDLAGRPDDLWRFSLPGTFFFFYAGMLLALLRLGLERRRPPWLDRAWAGSDAWVAGALAVWGLVCWRFELEPAMALAALLAVGACVLPLRRGRLVAALDWRPLAILGVASYSLYLWHLPIVNGLHRGALSGAGVPVFMLASLVVCCAVALVSYAVIEAPFLRLRRRWAAPTLDDGGPPGYRVAPPATARGVRSETT